MSFSPPKKLFPTFSCRYWVEEGYASEIAGEILVPEPFLRNISSSLGKGPCLETLIKLRSVFNVSFEVLLKKLLVHAHLWDDEIWGKEKWEAIVLTAEPLAEDNGNYKLKIYRSPGYEYKLKNITKRNEISEIINKILLKNESIDEIVNIGRNDYIVQASIVRYWPKLAILILHNQ